MDLANTLKAAVAPAPTPAATPAPASPTVEADVVDSPALDTEPDPKEADHHESPSAAEIPAKNSDDPGEKRRRPSARKAARPGSQTVPPAERPEKTTETAESGMSFYLPESISDRYLAFRLQTRRSRQVILFDAIEATVDDLPKLVKEALGEEDKPKRTLFERSGNVKTPVRVGDGEPKVIHRVRLTKTNRDVLTDLAEQFGAPSRTFLIVVALDAYLPKA
ncbi:hypothetical protein ABXJ56_15530 [Microbacterium chocolatum]|uniref:hypothetical protein n=1 Tax=Microbacterium aurantiacum TaxID=162393 RepID=UPI00338FFACE